MTLWMLGGVFALVGLPFVGIAARTFRRDRAVAAWPRAPGQITSSRLEQWSQTSRDRDGFDVAHTVGTPVVRYSYTVDGQEREGQRVAVAVDGVTMGCVAAQRIVDAYPVGKVVSVLVDPGDPTQAWLEVRRSIGAVILLGFGCLWLGIGALLVGLSLV